MATEPERPIEKLLRAWAKKRRDEVPERPGLELHPATRRLLQGEVARRFTRGGPQPGSLLRRLMLFRPRLAEGLVIIALMAVVASIMLPALGKSKSKATLAMNKHTVPVQPLSETRSEPASPPTRSPAKVVNGTEERLFASADAALNQRDKEVSLKAGEAELGKDRTAAVGGKIPPGSAITMNLESSGGARKGEAAQVTSASGTHVAPPTPSESPLLARNYGVAGGTAARGDIPAATPASAAAPVANTPLALAEKKPSGELLKSAGGNAGQPGFAYKSLNTDAAPPAPAASMDTKEAPGTVLADESKTKRELAALSKVQPQDAFQGGSNASKGTSFVQRFSQVAAVSGAQTGLSDRPLQPILVSFQVEQAGQELRVVDSDGSVYSGPLGTPSGLSRQRSARFDNFAKAKASSAPAGPLESPVTADAVRPAEQAYFFRVAGTNRSLKQKVVFTGNLIGLTNAASLAGAKGAIGDGAGGFPIAPPQQNFGRLLNLRISGKVVIGEGKAIEINALPTPGPAK